MAKFILRLVKNRLVKLFNTVLIKLPTTVSSLVKRSRTLFCCLAQSVFATFARLVARDFIWSGELDGRSRIECHLA